MAILERINLLRFLPVLILCGCVLKTKIVYGQTQETLLCQLDSVNRRIAEVEREFIDTCNTYCLHSYRDVDVERVRELIGIVENLQLDDQKSLLEKLLDQCESYRALENIDIRNCLLTDSVRNDFEERLNVLEKEALSLEQKNELCELRSYFEAYCSVLGCLYPQGKDKKGETLIGEKRLLLEKKGVQINENTDFKKHLDDLLKKAKANGLGYLTRWLERYKQLLFIDKVNPFTEGKKDVVINLELREFEYCWETGVDMLDENVRKHHMAVLNEGNKGRTETKSGTSATSEPDQPVSNQKEKKKNNGNKKDSGEENIGGKNINVGKTVKGGGLND